MGNAEKREKNVLETRLEKGDYSEETILTVRALIENSLVGAAERFLDLEDTLVAREVKAIEIERKRAEEARIREEKLRAIRITKKIDSAKKAHRTNGILTGKETGDLSRTVWFMAFGGEAPKAPVAKNGNKNEFGANYGVKSLYEAFVAGIFDETPKAVEARVRIRRLFA